MKKSQKNNRPVYLASNKKVKGVESLDLIKIKYLKFDMDMSKYDIFIFTSKNGVESFVQNYDIKGLKCCAISEKTAQVLVKHGADVIYTGKSGHGNMFAEELVKILKNKKVLYIRAKKVVSNLQSILNDKGIVCDDIIGYETTCNNENLIKLKKDAIIIFTSPSTVNCFFKNYLWDDSYHCVTIGRTTAKYLPDGVMSTISDLQNIDNCIKIARQI